MAVTIGSARIDERGKTTGGKAGDQTGRELSTQNWYNHSKGWRVFRARDPAAAEKMAWDMQAACNNRHIGYDQNQRGTLYAAAKPFGFNCAKVNTDCETDCSALVRVCAAYAGIDLPNFRTWDEARVLLASGAFVELTGDKYTASSAYLRRGDILVTRTKGHTVIVLSNGPKAEAAPASTHYKLGDRILKNGCEGDDVKALQEALISLGYDCGRWGADGDFGDATQMAVNRFQRDNGLEIDGEFGPLSMAALRAAMAAQDEPPAKARHVKIVGGNCYVRDKPNTSGRVLGVAHSGDVLTYRGETSADGWHEVNYNGKNGWVSGKYGRLEA